MSSVLIPCATSLQFSPEKTIKRRTQPSSPLFLRAGRTPVAPPPHQSKVLGEDREGFGEGKENLSEEGGNTPTALLPLPNLPARLAPPHPPKTFPSRLQQKFPGGISEMRGQSAGIPAARKRLWRKTGRNAVAGHPSPASILAIRTSLSCGHEPLWEGRDSTAPR